MLSEFHEILQTLEATTAKRMKIMQVLSVTEL